MKTYMLRDIDNDLWKRVKSLAAKNDETIRDIIERALKDYLAVKK